MLQRISLYIYTCFCYKEIRVTDDIQSKSYLYQLFELIEFKLFERLISELFELFWIISVGLDSGD